MKQGSVVLVDANVIIEAHRTGSWGPLSDYFDLHTVTKVVEETQTGFQNRDPETWIDEAALHASFRNIATITEIQRVAFNMNHGHPSLDDGERDLLIYAETFAEPIWLLNSPDMAAVKFAYGEGWSDQLVSLIRRQLSCPVILPHLEMGGHFTWPLTIQAHQHQAGY